MKIHICTILILLMTRLSAQFPCSFEVPRGEEVPFTESGITPPPGTDITRLNSYPEAPYVAFLDMDGQVLNIPGKPYLEAPDPNLTDTEKYEIWLIVSEDFLPFNINITTDSTVFEATPSTRRQRVLISDACWWFNACGFGGVNSNAFKSDSEVPAFVDPTIAFSNRAIGATASHELGHGFGLLHDGFDGPYQQGYYPGHADWAPIMGTGSVRNITQWSKGEYEYSNNQEDDLQHISGLQYGLGYRQDDYGNANNTAYFMRFSGNNLDNIEGIIEQNSDKDVFAFSTTGGQLSFSIQPAEYHPNLNIAVDLFNEDGELLQTFNPNNSMGCIVSAQLISGMYFIHVYGVGDGENPTVGYSDYGSLGYYSITGTLGGASNQTGIEITNYQLNTNGVEASAGLVLLDWETNLSPDSTFVIVNEEKFQGVDYDFGFIASIPINTESYLVYSIKAYKNGFVSEIVDSILIENSCLEEKSQTNWNVVYNSSEELSFGNWPAQNVVDGDLSSFWATGLAGLPYENPIGLTIDFGSEISFDYIKLIMPNQGKNGHPLHWSYWGGNTRTDSTLITTDSIAEGADFKNSTTIEESTRYLTLNVDSPFAYDWHIMRLAEIKVSSDTCRLIDATTVQFVDIQDGEVLYSDLASPIELRLASSDGRSLVSGYLLINGIRLPLLEENDNLKWDWIPQQEGSYQIEYFAYDEYGKYYSGVINIEISNQVTSLNQLLSGKYAVYPNPTSDWIYVRGTESMNLTLLDYNGRLIETQNSNRIDLSEYNSGIYFLIIETESEIHQEKIIKE